ncbi:MAG: PKD domain-containing protein, partial [Bacteroidia bacterium]|nr:PKD domain-containing protein [Bacteroidia bacterium]
PYPTPIITGDTILCAGTSTFYKNGNEAGHAYNWNVANGSLNSGQATDSITVTWTSAGQGKIVLLDSIIATGCSVQTDTFLVNIQANPSPVISGSIQTCANKIEVYQTPKDTGRTYSWEITGGIILSGGNTDSLVVSWGNVGTGTLQVTDSNNWTGCKTTTSVFNVNINPLPTPVISGSTIVCSGGTALYTTVDNPGRGYFWTANGGVITSGQGNDSVMVTWGASGNGRLNVSDSSFATGCVGTTSDYLVAILPLPTPVITGDTFLCEGTSTFYKNGNEPDHGYSWNVIGGNLISGQATDSIVVTWPNSGMGKIVLTDTIQSTGCLVQTDTFYIHINANPAPVVSGLNQVCANSIAVYQTPKDTGRSYNWTIGGGVFVFGETTDSVSVRWGNAGTGTMQVVDSVNYTGCKTTSSVFNVLINDVPVPVISGSVLLCSGATALYTTPSDTGRGYFWTVNGGVIASGQGNDSVTITWAGAGTGTLIVVDSIFVTGCKGVTEAYHVTVQPNPTPVISGSDTVCSGNVKMYVTPFNPGRSYFWSITGGTINSGQSKDTIFVTWGASGNGTLMVTDSVNDAGCKTTTAAFNVAILSNPTPIIAGKLAVCVNAIESYTTTGLLGHSYSWQVVGGTIVSGQGTNSIQVLWANAGSGTIRVTDSVNATGCLGISTPIVVSIFALPNPVVSGPTALCLGNSANYTITGNSGRTYLWTVVGGTIASGQGTSFLTVNWNVAGVGSVSVLDSVNATGCKSTSLPHDVTVFALPNPVITGANSVCNGTNMIYSTTNNSGHTYFWTVTGGTLASGQGTSNILVTWGTPGTGTISVRDSINSSGCEGTSANFNVVINSSPTPLISGLIEICEGGNATYTTPTVSGHSYIWNVIGGTIVSGQGTPSIDVNWPLNGSGSVEVTDSITGAGCKVTTLPYLVTIDTLPTPAISGNTIICEGSSHDYSVSASTNHDYQWTVSNGIITNGQGTSTITVSWGASGLGTINVIDSNEVTGCVGSATGYLVSIIGSPAPDVSGASVVCANSSSDYSTPNNSGRYYNWTVFGGTIIMGQGTSNISIMWGSVGSGYVYVTDSIEATGCVGTSSVFNVSISSNPTAVISGTFVRCVDNEAIYGTFNNTGRSFNWDVIGGTIQSGQSTASITVMWDMVGTGYVMLTDSITGSGCKASTFREVTVNPNPVGSFIVTQSGGIVTGIPDESGAYYTWDFGDGFNSSLANPSHLYATNGTYTISLVVRNQQGCAAFSSQSIDVTSVGLDATLAENFAIKAYPNPFYSTTKIGVNLSQSDVVEIEVFDLTGRNLGTLKPSERLAVGEHVFEFNSDNFALGSSVYLVRIKVGDTYRFLKIIDIGKD